MSTCWNLMNGLRRISRNIIHITKINQLLLKKKEVKVLAGVFVSLLLLIAILTRKTITNVSISSNDFLGISPFKELRNGNETFVATAYFQQDGYSVRIYLLRKLTNHPKIACSFPSQNHWNPSDDCHGNVYKEVSWGVFRAEYLDYAVCCNLPDSINSQRPSSINIAIATENGILETSQVTLPIGEGPPRNYKNFTFPHRFAVCIRPMYNTGVSLNTSYLIDYIELVRQLGGNLLIFYLSEQPDERILEVFRSYLAEPGFGGVQDDFQIKIVNWYRPVERGLGRTNMQVLAYNDCLYRFGRQVQYFHFTDLDELIVPHESVGDTWDDLVRGLTEHGWDEKYSSACFSGITFLMRYTSMMNISLFYADQTIQQTVWKPWRKCFGRSGQLQWMLVHWPMEPRGFFDGNAVGIVHHYYRCDLFRGSYCKKVNNITRNRVLWKHRILSEPFIVYRKRLLDM